MRTRKPRGGIIHEIEHLCDLALCGSLGRGIQSAALIVEGRVDLEPLARLDDIPHHIETGAEMFGNAPALGGAQDVVAFPFHRLKSARESMLRSSPAPSSFVLGKFTIPSPR